MSMSHSLEPVNVTSYDKRDFANLLKEFIMKRLCCIIWWTQYNYIGPCKRDEEESEAEERVR